MSFRIGRVSKTAPGILGDNCLLPKNIQEGNKIEKKWPLCLDSLSETSSVMGLSVGISG